MQLGNKKLLPSQRKLLTTIRAIRNVASVARIGGRSRYRKVSMSLAQLRKHPRVEIVDDERQIGNGVIVTLKKGWTFDPAFDNRVRGEDTIKEMLDSVRRAAPFEGPFDD